MITIAIKYDDIHSQVLRLSEYIGQKAKDYNGMRAIDEDKEQLLTWYRNGLAMVNIILDRLICKRVEFNIISGEAQITLKTFNDAEGLVKPTIEQLLVYHIIVGWLKLVAPALAPQYEQEEKDRQRELMNMCYYREMPI